MLNVSEAFIFPFLSVVATQLLRWSVQRTLTDSAGTDRWRCIRTLGGADCRNQLPERGGRATRLLRRAGEMISEVGGLGLEGPLRKRAPSASKGPKSYYMPYSCVAVHKRYVEGKYA